MKACDAIAEILKREGVDVLFGYPRNALIEAPAQTSAVMRHAFTQLRMRGV